MDIAIVGAGIAGSATALLLQERGHRVTLLEARGDSPDAAGAFLSIAPNGMACLGDMRLASAVEAMGAPSRGLRFLDEHGRRVALLGASDHRAVYGHPTVMLRRAHLVQLLRAAAVDAGADLRLNTPVHGLREVGGRFHLDISESAPRVDAVVGCDGIRSVVRRYLPDCPSPEDVGLFDVAGFCPPGVAALPGGWNTMVFGTRAFFGAFSAPNGEVWWFHNSNDPRVSGARDTARDHRTAVLREVLTCLHADDPAWIRNVVDATPQILGPWRLRDLPHVPVWHAGAVGLAGDAAHATSPSAGQGASLALEDAVALAKAWPLGTPAEIAFRTFVSRRRSRVERIVRQSRRNGSQKSPTTVWGRCVRNLILPIALRAGASAQHEQFTYRDPWPDRGHGLAP